MNVKTLGIIVAVLLGLFCGLMFNATQKSAILSQQLVAQQGETIDLLRTLVNNDVKFQETVVELEKKVGNVDATIKNIAKAAPQKAQRPQEDYTTVYKIPQGEAVIKGQKSAPLTIVGFLDLQCPFSRRFQPVIDQVLEAYPDKVKYIVKHFPLSFHKQAIPAVKAVLAAGEQGKFYEMMAVVLENNRNLSAEKFEELAEGIGLNVKKFKKALEVNDAAWDKLIKEDFALGQKVGVRGTPTFYLEGKKTRSRTLEAFKAEIDKILAEKK